MSEDGTRAEITYDLKEGYLVRVGAVEYTVIGDPVNEASRLTELAKLRPSRVLASSSALYFADDDERGHWELGDEVQLRGRRRVTQLASPVHYPSGPRPGDDSADRVG